MKEKKEEEKKYKFFTFQMQVSLFPTGFGFLRVSEPHHYEILMMNED